MATSDDSKKLNDLEKKLKSINGDLKEQSGWWDDISSSLLGLNLGKFYKETEATTDEIKKWQTELEKTNDKIKDNTTVLINSFKTVAGSAKKDLIDSIQKNANFASDEIAQSLLKALQKNDISEFLNEYGETGVDAFKKIVKDKNFIEFSKFLNEDAHHNLVQAKIDAETFANAIDKKVITSFVGWEEVSGRIGKQLANNFNIKSLIGSLVEFDSAIHKLQQESGIMVEAKNALGFSELTVQASRFGMSIGDTTDFMGALSSQLRTTNFDTIATATKDMSAFSKATGISAKESGDLIGNLMLFGSSSEKITEFTEGVLKQSALYGVSGKKAVQDIAANLIRFRTMGFQGGEASLGRMVIQAQRLGLKVNEVFDFTEKARTIEGALEMASELQLAGGSFSNINPIELLSAANKGPEELQKILAKMGNELGHFDEKSKEYMFDPVDSKRLAIVADATGIKIDSLENKIKLAYDQRTKLSKIPFNILGSLDDNQKTALSGLIKLKEGGKFDLGGKEFENFASLTQYNIKSALENAARQKDTLEKMALSNQSFVEAKKAFTDSFSNVFTIFQPVLMGLTSIIKGLNSIPYIGKGIALALIGAGGLLFEGAKMIAAGFSFGIGFNRANTEGGLLKKITGFGKKGESTPDLGIGGKGGGGFIKNFTDQLAGIKGESVKGAAYLAAIGVIFAAGAVGITYLMSKIDTSNISVESAAAFGGGLAVLAGSMALISKLSSGIDEKKIGMFALASIGISVAVGAMGLALQQFKDVKFSDLGVAALAILGAVITFEAIGAIAEVGFPALAGGFLALAAVAGDVALLGLALNSAAPGFTAFGNVNWSNYGGAVIALTGLAGAGLLGLAGSAGLVLLSYALGDLSSVMSTLAPNLDRAAIAIGKMADNVVSLKSAVSGLDVNALENLSKVSGRLASSGVITNNAVVANNTNNNVQKFEFAPVDLRVHIDGQTVQTHITEFKLKSGV